MTGRGWAFAFIGLFALSPVHADDVAPSARVTSRLNIRAAPSTDSAIVGKLAPGESAPLIGAEARWYAIRLPTGGQGFVSKSWSVVVAAPEFVRLGVWNLKKLGHGDTKDYDTVRDIIEQHFDVLGIVEIMQKNGGRPGYDALMHVLGPAWVGQVTDTPRPNTASGSAEFYAVIYRRDQARLCDGWTGLRYYADSDGTAGNGELDRFVREPAYTCMAIVSADGDVQSDFLFGVFHATWNDGDASIIREEASHIDAVLAAMAADQTGEQDVILAGDFNLNSNALQGEVSAADRTRGAGSTLNRSGERTANLYDHVLLSNEEASRELEGDAEVIDPDQRVANGAFFYSVVSDHLPLAVRWNRSIGDDD